MDEKEFEGKRFYPAMFFWKNIMRESEEVAATCRILNAMTPEQIMAVEYFASDMRTQDAWDRETE